MNHIDIEAMYAPKMESIKAINIKNRALMDDVAALADEQFAAFERERNVNKAEKFHSVNDARALDLQIQQQKGSLCD